MPLTEKERITILMMRGYGDRERSFKEVAGLFNETNNERAPISASTVRRTVLHFQETGSVKDAPRSGRPKTASSDDKSLEVLQHFEENPHTSSRKVAKMSDISHTSVLRILKREKYHPYKIQLHQELLGDDFDRRTEFCELVIAKYDANDNFLFWTCFSDEATFQLNGSVNRHNMRYWAKENPRWMRESHTQFPQKVNVWAGILCHRIIGPFFIDGNLTGEKYLNMLQDVIVPSIRNVTNDSLHCVWFQQDGAQPHFAVSVREFLDETFPRHWIGRRGSIEWPPRSPDLSPLDFFYWGYLKNKVFETKIGTIEELKDRILIASNGITQDVIRKVTDEIYYRLAHCQVVEGHVFEHLI